MNNNIIKRAPTGNDSPFEKIKRINDAGNEYWSSRDFSRILGYSDYRNFEQVIKKAKKACFNSGHRIEDHFVDITEMIEIGKGGPNGLYFQYICPVMLLRQRKNFVAIISKVSKRQIERIVKSAKKSVRQSKSLAEQCLRIYQWLRILRSLRQNKERNLKINQINHNTIVR